MTTRVFQGEGEEGVEQGDSNEIDFLRASDAAQAALDDQNEAKDLTQRAAATEDPLQRESLLRRALDKEVRARKQGKTAEWLRDGAVQGALSGAGIGSAMGAGLGLLTGTVVGSTTSLAFGGLGAGFGGGIGALRGPFYEFDDEPTEDNRVEQIDDEELIVVEQPAAVSSPVEAERVLGEVARQKTPPPARLESIAKEKPQKVSVSQDIRQEEVVQVKKKARKPLTPDVKPMLLRKESDGSGTRSPVTPDKKPALAGKGRSIAVQQQLRSEIQIQETKPVPIRRPRTVTKVETLAIPKSLEPLEVLSPRKKPRKLEIKSPPKKKPRKLEVRSPANTP